MRRARRARLPRRVGAGRGEWCARGRDERAGYRVRGHAHCDGGMTGRDDRRDARRVHGEEECERAGPERAHEGFVGRRGGIGRREEGSKHRGGGYVYDQRIVGRSALGGEDFGGGGRVEGESTEAIDGLRWKGDDMAFCQVLDSSFDGVLGLWIRVDRFVIVTRESDRLRVTFKNSCWRTCHGGRKRSRGSNIW